MNSLFAREQPGKKAILPIWHGITRHELIQYGLAFACRLAMISSIGSYSDIVESLLAMLGRPNHQERKEASVGVSTPTNSRLAKQNAVAYAQYETTENNALRAEAYVRPSTKTIGWFTFENSLGEEEHGTKEEIAKRVAVFDKSLMLRGYIRMHYGNARDRAFNLSTTPCNHLAA